MVGRQRFSFLDHPPPLAFAHRGGALEADENTEAAFANAARLGFTHVETDVQASRDGIAVLFHDDDLARMTGRPGRVRDYPWAELATFRTPSGQPLLRLDELLESHPTLCCNLEIKAADAVEPMAAAIRRQAALARVSAGAFDVRWTVRLRRLLGPELCWSPAQAGVLRVWLQGWGLPLPAPDFPAVQVPPTHRFIPLVTSRFVRAAHRHHVQVHVWTVDDEPSMERLLDLGVDGLMTDRPSRLRAVLRRRGQWHGAADG